jgi:hypothetical protein
MKFIKLCQNQVILNFFNQNSQILDKTVNLNKLNKKIIKHFHKRAKLFQNLKVFPKFQI